jgi:hypothetical protein
MVRPAIAILCAMLLAPASASASTFATPQPWAAPVLAGPRVQWAVPGPGLVALREASRGRRPSTIATFQRGFNVVNFVPSLAASPSRTAISFIAEDPAGYTERRVYTAPSGGTFETLDEGCQLYGGYDVPRAIDVSGEVVVFPRCDPHGASEVVVRDYSTSPAAEEVIAGAKPNAVRIAGRYVAWLDQATGFSLPAGIVVYDRARHEIAYRIAQSEMPGHVYDLDVQDDGKVAFSVVLAAGPRIAWASPTEPRPHVLPLAARERFEVHITGDRIGFETGTQPCCGFVSSANVGVTDLAGHSRGLGNLGEGTVFDDNMDFDGKRVAWWTYGCTRAFVHVISAGGPPLILPRRSGCPLRFARKPLIVDGRVHVYVDCFGFVECFTSKATLTVRRHNRRITVGRGHSALRIALKPAGKALLRRHHALRVRATVTISDGEQKRETRSGPVTLRG